MPSSNPDVENRKEACKTYVEQTKLLVTLASAFIVVPPTALGLFKSSASVKLSENSYISFLFSEASLVLSVILGYLALGSIAGSQDDGSFNVYRPATRIFSIMQIALYLSGVIIFLILVKQVLL
jgi:hypothetical protein